MFFLDRKRMNMGSKIEPLEYSICSKAIGGQAYPYYMPDTATTKKTGRLPKMTAGWSGSQLFLNMDDSDKFHELYEKVSEHDRMIVDRMARKRTEELAMIEEAQVARRYWEDERRARQQVMLEQNEVLTRLLKERREQDSHDTLARIENLRNRDRWLTDRLREELDAKECLVDLRLQRLNCVREHQTNERRQMHMEKARQISQNNEDLYLDQKLQQQLIIGHLEDKIHRAEYQKQKYLEAQRHRLQFDQEMEQKIHAAKLIENQRFEQYQKQKLMDTIKRSDQKSRAILESKRRELEESRIQARNSAFLRDFVRRSFTPDVTSLGTVNLFSTRSFKSV